MNRRALIWVMLVLGACAGCSDSDGGGGGNGATAGTSGSGGSSGSSGSSGSAGAGGALQGRLCADGAPCSAGATCKVASIESGANCECDASGHFMCDGWASAGAPPFTSCDAQTACAPEPGPTDTCTQSNGYCTRSCQCQGSCTTECTGTGPAEGYPGFVCDLAYCDTPFGEYGSCEVTDGACSYKVSCGNSPTLTGSCP